MVDFGRAPIEGVVALAPFAVDDDGGVDHAALRANVDYLESKGVHGVIQFASMGQMYAPSEAEFDAVVDTVVDAADDVTCVVGAMAPNQREVIRRATYAEDAGADAAMIALPYAFPMREEWVGDFFRDVDDALDELAVMVYNYPPLTDVNVSASMWREELLDVDCITALKESNFSVLHHDEVLVTVREEINFISPGDSLFWHDSMLGAEGFIGILTWVAPDVFTRFYAECAAGNHDDPWVREVNETIVRTMGRVTSVVPLLPYEGGLLNALADIGGRPAGRPRAPYRALPDGARAELEAAVEPLRELERDL